MSRGELDDATIVFDLDGTLVDTAPDLVAALNATLDLEGLARVRLQTVRTMVGRGARALIEQAMAQAGASYGGDRLDQLTQAFIEFYRADIARESRLFPGAVEALDALAAMGARLAVCTNKRTGLSTALLDALGVTARFATIVGADAVVERKPHPDHFRAAVERAGGSVERALMVGDTAADIGAARGAGAPVAAVRFGYSDIDADQLGADAVLDHFSELAPLALRLLARPA